MNQRNIRISITRKKNITLVWSKYRENLDATVPFGSWTEMIHCQLQSCSSGLHVPISLIFRGTWHDNMGNCEEGKTEQNKTKICTTKHTVYSMATRQKLTDHHSSRRGPCSRQSIPSLADVCQSQPPHGRRLVLL